MRFRPTYRNIWGISFPIILAGISETIVDITDTVFLAHYGITELAAIGVADAIYGLALFITLGLVDGIQIIIGRRAGQEQPIEIGHVFNQGLYLLTVAAVILIAPQTWSEAYATADYQERYGKPLAPVLEKARGLVEAGKGDTLMDPVDFIYCEQTRATAAAFVSYYTPDSNMDTPSLITDIKPPVLVIAGSEDTAIKGLPEKVEPLADGKHVQLMVIDGADHFFRDLYSEDIADAVAELLADD